MFDILKQRTTLFLVFAVSVLTALPVSARDWTAKSGHKAQGDFVKLEDGIVHIEQADGNTRKIKLELLSDADQNYVKLQSRKKSSPATNKTQPVVSPVPSPQPADGTTAGERMVLTINGVEYPFRWCPPGTFMMGSPEDEKYRQRNAGRLAGDGKGSRRYTACFQSRQLDRGPQGC